MFRAVKLRLYPNRVQEQNFNQNAGCCRWIYNHFLNEKIKWYGQTGTSLSRFDQQSMLPSLKFFHPWLKDPDATSLQNSIKNLHQAYSNFFRRAKTGEAPGFPKFKRKGIHDSFTCTQSLYVDGDYLKIGKHGCIKTRGDYNLLIGHTIKSITVSRDGTQWYASCLIECPEVILDHVHKYQACGIDLGTKIPLVIAAVTKDGELVFKVSGNKVKEHLEKKAQRRKHYQRSMARKQLGSNNRKKEKLKVQKACRKERNVRKDYAEKTSLKLVQKFKLIKFEDLKLVQMTKNGGQHKTGLNHDLLNLGLGALVSATLRKANKYGTTVEFVDPRNTSRECSCCGHISKKNRKSQAIFKCISCGHTQNADHNVAINILNRPALAA